MKQIKDKSDKTCVHRVCRNTPYIGGLCARHFRHWWPYQGIIPLEDLIQTAKECDIST